MVVQSWLLKASNGINLCACFHAAECAYECNIMPFGSGIVPDEPELEGWENFIQEMQAHTSNIKCLCWCFIEISIAFKKVLDNTQLCRWPWRRWSKRRWWRRQ